MAAFYTATCTAIPFPSPARTSISRRHRSGHTQRDRYALAVPARNLKSAPQDRSGRPRTSRLPSRGGELR